MKTSIGIRATPSQVFYSVVTETDNNIEIKLTDKVILPKSMETPEQLKFLRSTLLDIINENNATLGCIRIAEASARSISVPRIYLEGVIQELIASSSIERYYVGQISNISAKLNINRNEFKPFVANENIFMGIAIWPELNAETRECVMAAISALNL
ncbi:hypothetical protein [Flavobacterium selenitireducens]|uniref:hypothetical protein n=1 Tax=Flavobacterium selenitireducens TaxID=2722704 RepID=UPI00168A9A16|nr:hypothetical protein [Flavobacterium selenitireducens]MBD3582742.1 hypothetical protein [Flavobacterium selenitireducens]